MNYFYLDQNGTKQGPITHQQLQALAAQGVILPTTLLRTDTGHLGHAGKIPGLFVAPVQQVAQPQLMANFFYYDTTGQKFGPVNEAQLKALAMRGIINPQTPMETDTGHKGQAGQIPGIFSIPVQQTAQPQLISQSVPVSEVHNRKNPALFIAGIISVIAAVICLLLVVYFQSEMLKYAELAQSSKDWLSAGYNKGEVDDAAFARNCCVVIAVLCLIASAFFFTIQRKRK